jgi:hypothetical protein
MTSARLDDPTKVARLISKLSDAQKVPLRNIIGKDALLVRLLQKVLPECLRLRLISASFNYALKKASPGETLID